MRIGSIPHIDSIDQTKDHTYLTKMQKEDDPSIKCIETSDTIPFKCTVITSGTDEKTFSAESTVSEKILLNIDPDLLV